MITKVFAVYDKAVGAFLQPFMARSDGEAVRMFERAANGQSDFSANVADYELFMLSEFNDLTGEYGVKPEDKLSVPRRVCTGLEVLSRAKRMLTKDPVEEVAEVE